MLAAATPAGNCDSPIVCGVAVAERLREMPLGKKRQIDDRKAMLLLEGL